VLAIDGTYKPAFDMARRFKLDLGTGRAPAGGVDLDSDAIAVGGAIAPVEDELDFDPLHRALREGRATVDDEQAHGQQEKGQPAPGAEARETHCHGPSR